MRIFILIITGLFLSLAADSQDLTGTWEGNSGMGYIKLCIIRVNGMYFGYTYDNDMGFCKANFKGKYNIEHKRLKGINDGMIEKSGLHSQSRYNLHYRIIDGKEYLKGIATPKSAGAKILSMGIPLPVTYTRINSTVDTTDYMLSRVQNFIDTVAVAATLTDTTNTGNELASSSVIILPSTNTYENGVSDSVTTNIILKQKNDRIDDTLSTIDITEKKLLIKVMDNGVVDGDTVSIVHNGQVIANRISVREIPFEIEIANEGQNDYHEIVLVAHNLGKIPPNTALILIETPSKQYRLTASTDLKKNAMIIFRYNGR